jgi:purine-binding chemotaxis protein CheW
MTGTRTYLRFDVAGEGHALPMELVREILRVPPLVRVPQGPASLEGLGNLRGRVLPVVSLSGLLGKHLGGGTASARVLVLDRTSLLGLRVDAVHGLVTVGRDRVEDDGGSTVLRMQSGDLRVIDPGPLLAAEFKPQPRGLRSGQARPVGDDRADVTAPAGQVGLIGFELAGRHYALPLDGVREVLSLPPDIAVLPWSDEASFGVATLRGRTLPILSGRALLGVPTVGQEDGGARLIVIPLGTGSFGVLVDRITSIHRTDAAGLDPVPAILGRGPRPEAEVQAIARMDGRLVAVLSPDRLLGPERAGRILAMDNEAGGTMAPVEEEAQQFILFRLGDTECAISIGSVEEVARVPDRLSTLPRAPAYVKGVMTLRGQALPVVDLRGRLDLPPVPPSGRERVLVLSSKGQRAGFIVDAVHDVARLPASSIEPAPELADGQAMVVTQAANLAEAGRLILLIDAGRLLAGTEMLAQDAPLP